MNLQAMFEIVINLHSNSQFDLHFLELWVSVNVCINKCTISLKTFTFGFNFNEIRVQHMTYCLYLESFLRHALHYIVLHCIVLPVLPRGALYECGYYAWVVVVNLLENQGSASEGTSTMLTRRWLMDDPREHWAWPDQSGVNHLIVTIKQTKIQYII